jgi:hypothetical protein
MLYVTKYDGAVAARTGRLLGSEFPRNTAKALLLEELCHICIRWAGIPVSVSSEVN